MRVDVVPGEAFFLFDWKQVKPNVVRTNKMERKAAPSRMGFSWPFEPALYNP